MQSIAYIPGSNGAGNASQMTVQTLRSPGASDIIVNTVTGVSTKFYGSMGAPHTFTDPVTGEIITIISEATAVDFAGHVDTGKIVIDAIAPGYVDTRGSLVGDIVVVRPVTEWANNLFNVLNQSHNLDGTIKDSAITYVPNAPDHVFSGGIWSTLAGLNATMSALTIFQGGYKGTIAAVASRAFTSNKDTYVDVLRTTVGTTTTFTLVYNEVANAAAAPVLAANSVRLGFVKAVGAAITQYTQDGTVDSLGEPIYPLLNSRRMANFAIVLSNQPSTTSASPQPINGYSLPLKTRTGRVLVTVNAPFYTSANNGQLSVTANGTEVDIINTSGANGLGMGGKKLITGLPKDTTLNFPLNMRISGGATVALLQFKHLDFTVEEA